MKQVLVLLKIAVPAEIFFLTITKYHICLIGVLHFIIIIIIIMFLKG
jgi:hypothetical protein